MAYVSPHGEKGSAFLIVPLEQPPQAGLIFGHWGEGNREEFVQTSVRRWAALFLQSPERETALLAFPHKGSVLAEASRGSRRRLDFLPSPRSAEGSPQRTVDDSCLEGDHLRDDRLTLLTK